MSLIKQTSLADQVYEVLKEKILSKEIKGGEKIQEEELARQFGVSRTPIREAIRRLSEYGLVTLNPRTHAEVNKINDREALDIAKVRIALECFAIDNIDPKILELNFPTLSRHAADCFFAFSTGKRAEAFEYDSLFHSTLIKTTGNNALMDLYNRLDAKVQQLRIEQDEPDEELSMYIGQHGTLMQLLKDNKKQQAKELLKKHILHDMAQKRSDTSK
ncbi:MAG: GntR family transcriptional regulator [Spirochaetia bacterium]|jgi:DNA-binding GntR family transcriptional regulator|nr:GntR family transcriptional regulator [Spirochaetia bacterium]